jgi:hypothetical protein
VQEAREQDEDMDFEDDQEYPIEEEVDAPPVEDDLVEYGDLISDDDMAEDDDLVEDDVEGDAQEDMQQEEIAEACGAAQAVYSCEVLMTNYEVYAEMEVLEQDMREKVVICHIPPGNPENARTITISQAAVDQHIGIHGDLLGPCEGDAPIEEVVDVCL